MHAMRVPGLLSGSLTELLALVGSGDLRAVPGGDYPLSATIMSEYANKRTRGEVKHRRGSTCQDGEGE